MSTPVFLTNIILHVKDNIKTIITSKFKKKLWHDKELEGKIKFRYYKEMINHNLEDQSISLF